MLRMVGPTDEKFDHQKTRFAKPGYKKYLVKQRILDKFADKIDKKYPVEEIFLKKIYGGESLKKERRI